MNREQRRRFNKKHKTNFTKAEFDQFEFYQRLKAGEVSLDELSQLPEGMHLDNEELVPEGIPVKLAYDDIMSRPKKGLTNEFLTWIEEHKDEVMHVTRKNAQSSMVCLSEDKPWLKENYTDEDTNIGHVPWLFDIWSDLLYENPENHEWINLANYQEIVKKPE